MNGLSVSSNELVDALLFVERATGRTVTDSLNRAAKHTIIGSGSHKGAMQLTPKATAADIARVTDTQLRGYVIRKAKRTGKWPMSSNDVNKAVKKERARRRSATGYAAYAGWSNAAKRFGGRGVKGVHGGFAQSEAVHGYGKKATQRVKEAVAVNTAPAAERIGFDALEQGMSGAAKDLITYGTRKMQQDFNKVH